MHTTTTIERQEAETTLSTAQAKSAAAKAVFAELTSRLGSEKDFRALLAGNYDRACVEDRPDDARNAQAELTGSDARLRGLQLRLESATSELDACTEAEQHAIEELTRLACAEGVEIEHAELQQMIEDAFEAYDASVRAAEVLEQSIAALKNRAYLDEAHKKQALDAAFKLSSRLHGFNF